MRILFLDDMQTRHDAFRRNTIGHEVVSVFTAAEAIKILDTTPRFDLAQLDHDLADEHYDADYATDWEARQQRLIGTGMDVIDFIIKMPEDKWPLKIVAHTFNERGREMVRRLQDAGIKNSSWVRFNPKAGV